MRRRVVALAAVLTLAAACTGGAGEEQSPYADPTPEPWRGGTLRLAMVGGAYFSYVPERALDPQFVYEYDPWELLRCCLLRTLFSYNGRPTSEGGADARPDLAAGPSEISADGLTWTIRIKEGIHYAPPMEDVEITAQDFIRALMREATPDVDPGYPDYYSAIQGFDAYRSGDAETISGLETPDEHTLVIRLTGPAGDLPYRLALAAAAPIPPNPYRPDAALGAAQGHDRTYQLYLIASGPYMIEGSEELDLSLSPKNQNPIAGYVLPRFDKDGNVLAPGSLTLVRNPSWDPATDDLRAAYPDRIEIQIRAEGDPATPSYRAATRELAAAVEAGTVDHVLDLDYTPNQIQRYQEDPQMEGRATTLPVGVISFIVMNVAMAPFDDPHVRRAVAFAIDERRLLRTLSSASVQAVVASHLAPDDLEGDVLADYDPYPTSLERARQEMALSGYDRDGDGRCDAPECRGVLALMRKGIVGPAAAEEVAARLNGIGIELRLREGGELLWCPSGKHQRWPLFMGCRWASDFPNGSAFLPPLLGLVEVPVPTVDERIDRCVAITGADQTECWAELDRYLMEEVVPLIPYMADTATFVVSERVATSSYSVPTSGLALDRTALVEGSE